MVTNGNLAKQSEKIWIPYMDAVLFVTSLVPAVALLGPWVLALATVTLS